MGDGPRSVDATSAAMARLADALGGASPDLVFVFPSSHFAEDGVAIATALRARFGDAVLLGCSGGGVIGGWREIERQPAVALVGAVLPDVRLTAFHVPSERLYPLALDPSGWHDVLGVIPEEQPAFVLLPDPFTVDAAQVLTSFDVAYPRCPVVGGLASGGGGPGEHVLFCVPRGEDPVVGTVDGGLVGLALVGDVALDTIVAQGCRPIGPALEVTRCDRNLLFELDGHPAIAVLETIFEALDESDQGLFRRSPMLGVAMEPGRGTPRRGDFLVRGLLGIDRVRRLIGVGFPLDVGQSVQFHVRDATTSAEDLTELLARYAGTDRGSAPAGALLFSCLGRGAYLYGVADHDTKAFRTLVGEVPVGGFFCNGEIGPVHARSWLHGYTSSFGIFRPKGLAWA